MIKKYWLGCEWAMSKLKSNVAWDNYVMRKYGYNIRKQIFHDEIDRVIRINMIKEKDALNHLTESVWISNTDGRC